MRVGEATDAELVDATLAGDEDAFSQLYHRYRTPVTRFVARTVGDPHLAEDLVQEAFVRALRLLGDLRDPLRFRPWLFSIAHRAALDHVRRGGPVLLWDLPEVAGDDSPHENAAAREAVGLVWDAAASLEPRQLAILELTVRDEVTNAELAQALDVRASHAAVLAHRARSALGHAVRLLLLARNPRRCSRLAGLVPDRPRTLSRAQRASVDRHLRRCPECRDLAGRLTTPLAAFGVLLVAAGRTSSVPVDQAAWALADPSRHLVRKSLVTLGLTVALTVGWWFVPSPQEPPPVVAPPPTTTTTREPVPPPVAPVANVPPPTTTTVATTTTTPRPPSEVDKLITALNQRRSAEGCGPVRSIPQLTTAARAHSTDMMNASHIGLTSPDGTSLADRVKATGYRGMRGAYVAAYRETGAELAKELAAGDTPALSCEVDTIGVGRAVGGECGYYWAIVYGKD
ncbi:RNA polymerase sigma-54 factor RpoN [Alloactinosynnema sp. L-07]|uniref:sigma-70 family RNA polymerase sigma factor n=1 Tax=Alloactinosynnema sp. L-07 TaxID=1653480 RepID=UPI00065EF484|nr:sigma-70 family RNA polymerase sigma factor [Alloactinosynnema sp. L-07]CRK62108.1 RNA polymerase sigma-54 factor RpoN [Alloactinosynnema sp. L-07]